MGLRNMMNENKAVGGIVIALILVASVYFAISNLSGGTQPVDSSTTLWFYDLGEKKLVSVSREELAPMDLPSGAMNGVLAHVYACNCANESEHVIAYLERYTTEGLKKRRDKGSVDGAGDLEVRAVDGDWVKMDAPEAQTIMSKISEIADKCKSQGGSMQRCVPGTPK